MCQRQSSGAHVAERGGNAALRRDGVRAGREHLGDAGGLQARLGAADARAQARAAGADDDDVEGVVGDRIGLAAERGGAWAVGAVVAIRCEPFSTMSDEADAQHGVDAGEPDGAGEESIGDQRPFARVAMHVVEDDRAHADLHVIDADQHEQQRERSPEAARPSSARTPL